MPSAEIGHNADGQVVAEFEPTESQPAGFNVTWTPDQALYFAQTLMRRALFAGATAGPDARQCEACNSLQHRVVMIEEDRQMMLLAIAKLAEERPGWEWTLGELAKKLHGREMFDSFRHLARE